MRLNDDGSVLMFGWFAQLKAVAAGRSSKWPAVRAAHLRLQPQCQWCGRDDDLDVHHVIPRHKCPEMECQADNLLTLCRHDHFVVGHLGSWESWNVNVRDECHKWQIRRKNRP